LCAWRVVHRHEISIVRTVLARNGLFPSSMCG
jgi:hypothetical protein